MAKRDESGIEDLAEVIAKRIGRQTTDNSISMDFGTIKSNMNLQTDSFPIEIEPNKYAKLRCEGINHECFWYKETKDKEKKHCDGHMHLEGGERVLVLWVSEMPVIVGVLDT